MMKKRLLCKTLLVMALMSFFLGCQDGQEEISISTEETETVTEEESTTEEFVSETDAEGNYTVQIQGEIFWVNGTRAIEPENTVDLTTAKISDFGGNFTEEYPVKVSSYTLLSGTVNAVEVVHISSENPGPVVYVVSGIHGDEIAGWYAGTLLKSATISSGDLYVIAPANAQGAKNKTRYVTGSQDLNRVFPGGTSEAGKIAAAIYSDIQDKQPDLLLDLHEAIVYSNKKDFLGSTLIFTELTGMEELFFDLLLATQLGDICQGEFGYSGPAPDGSINATVSRELGIPAITVETFRGYTMERRIGEQLDIVEYVLSYLGMQ